MSKPIRLVNLENITAMEKRQLKTTPVTLELPKDVIKLLGEEFERLHESLKTATTDDATKDWARSRIQIIQDALIKFASYGMPFDLPKEPTDN